MLQKPVTRRTLLKALLAGSGAIGAASFLPEKWVKPIVNSGVLPVHAQSLSSHNYVQGHAGGGMAFAYVSSDPFTYQPGNYKMASPVRAPAPPEHPVSGVTVTLYNSTKSLSYGSNVTGSDGKTGTAVDWSFCQNNLSVGDTLTFSIIGDSDSVTTPPFQC